MSHPFVKWTVAGILILLIGIGTLATNVIWFRPISIDIFFERTFLEFALKQPELMSSLRILEQFGYYEHNSELTNPSDETALANLQDVKAGLEMLRSYDRGSLSEQQLLSADILDWFLEDSVRNEEFLYHSYPVNQMFGVQNELPSFMVDTHQVNNERDAEHYLTRLKKFTWKFDKVLGTLRSREEKGILPPTFVIDRVVTEMTGFIDTPSIEHMLYQSFKTKLEDADEITIAKKTEFLSAAQREIEQSVYPAYQSLIDYFENLRPSTTIDDGAWKHPNGAAYYASRLRAHTTTNKTPKKIHEIGLREVDRIQSEMRSILDELGHSGDTVAGWMVRLAKEPRFLYPNTDAGREQSLARYREIIADAGTRLDPLFNKRPNSGVEVQRIPPFKEKTSASHYKPPAMDGSRPGMFFAKLYDMNDDPMFGMKTLAYHEAIPGHHFQIALQQELTGVPTFRKILPFTAYSEGWALYAELLAGEYGFHGDPYSDLGRLQSELFRAVRLVVDTGIHYKRWTRDEAIKYMVDNTGLSEGGVTSEIERYIVMPGQACAYKMGQLMIVELRERSRRALGAAFDIREFHDVVLQNGSMPLEILEKVVDQYIERKKV